MTLPNKYSNRVSIIIKVEPYQATAGNIYNCVGITWFWGLIINYLTDCPDMPLYNYTLSCRKLALNLQCTIYTNSLNQFVCQWMIVVILLVHKCWINNIEIWYFLTNNVHRICLIGLKRLSYSHSINSPGLPWVEGQVWAKGVSLPLQHLQLLTSHETLPGQQRNKDKLTPSNPDWNKVFIMKGVPKEAWLSHNAWLR